MGRYKDMEMELERILIDISDIGDHIVYCANEHYDGDYPSQRWVTDIRETLYKALEKVDTVEKYLQG